MNKEGWFVTQARARNKGKMYTAPANSGVRAASLIRHHPLGIKVAMETRNKQTEYKDQAMYALQKLLWSSPPNSTTGHLRRDARLSTLIP